MTNRTSPQTLLEQVASRMESGHPSFSVLLSAPGHREGMNHYVVAVPMAVMRSGFGGWISKKFTSEWGKPTAFGNDLFRLVNRIEGVELSLDNDHPHVVKIFTDSTRMEDSAPPKQFPGQARMMPAVVCQAIEAVILRNQSLGQRFTEWLRRLI